MTDHDEIEKLRKENTKLLWTCQGWANTVSDFTRRRDEALERADAALARAEKAEVLLSAHMEMCVTEQICSDKIVKDREALRALLDEAREALEPFKEMADFWEPGADARDDDPHPVHKLRIIDLRRAKEVLAAIDAALKQGDEE